MKKDFLIVSFMVIFCFTNVLWASEIIYLEGKVEVKRKQEKVWQPAKVGMKVEAGDMILTRGMDSRVDIDLDESKKGDRLLRLGENTQVVLRSSFEPNQIDNIDLDSGSIFSKIEKIKGGSTFEVYTLTVVAGVRGTDWGVSTKKDEEAEINCYKGRIYVKTFGPQGELLKKIDVDAGYSTNVKKFQPPTELAPISEKKQEEWKENVKELLDNIEEYKKKEEVEETGQTDNAKITQEVNSLYERFKQAYSQSDRNGVLVCISKEWESSEGSSFYDLDDRLNKIFSTFDRVKIEMNGFSVQPSDDPEYAARVEYYLKIDGSLFSNPNIKHHEEGQVTEYIKKEKDQYLIGKTIGKGAF